MYVYTYTGHYAHTRPRDKCKMFMHICIHAYILTYLCLCTYTNIPTYLRTLYVNISYVHDTIVPSHTHTNIHACTHVNMPQIRIHITVEHSISKHDIPCLVRCMRYTHKIHRYTYRGSALRLQLTHFILQRRHTLSGRLEFALQSRV
jgi:hypothetical protein